VCRFVPVEEPFRGSLKGGVFPFLCRCPVSLGGSAWWAKTQYPGSLVAFFSVYQLVGGGSLIAGFFPFFDILRVFFLILAHLVHDSFCQSYL
jgi:hypothetical protein